MRMRLVAILDGACVCRTHIALLCLPLGFRSAPLSGCPGLLVTTLPPFLIDTSRFLSKTFACSPVWRVSAL